MECVISILKENNEVFNENLFPIGNNRESSPYESSLYVDFSL